MPKTLYRKSFFLLAAATLAALLVTTPAIVTLVDPAQPPPFSFGCRAGVGECRGPVASAVGRRGFG